MTQLHRWTFDEIAPASMVDVGLGGELSNGTPSANVATTFGLFGRAQDFSGNDDAVVNCGVINDLAMASPELKFYLWFRLDDPADIITLLDASPNKVRGVLSRSGGVGSYGYWLDFDFTNYATGWGGGPVYAGALTVNFHSSDDGTNVYTVSGDIRGVDDGQWHKLTVYQIAEHLRIVVDTLPVGYDDYYNVAYNNPGSSFLIGNLWTTDSSFPGAIDEVEALDSRLYLAIPERLYNNPYQAGEFVAGAYPTLISSYPEAGSLNIPRDTHAEFVIRASEPGHQIDLNQTVIFLDIDGAPFLVYEYASGGWQSGFAGSQWTADGQGGYRGLVYFDALFDEGSNVGFAITTQTEFPESVQTFGFSWQTVTDLTGPQYADRRPGYNETLVNSLTDIAYDIFDDESDLDMDTLFIQIKIGAAAWEDVYDHDGGGWQGSWTGTINSIHSGDAKRCDVLIDNPSGGFPGGGETIQVRTVIDNQAATPVQMDEITQFTVAIYPYFVLIDPYDGETEVGTAKVLQLYLSGGDWPLDPDTVEVSILGTLAFDADGGQWQTGFAGAGSTYYAAGDDWVLFIDHDPNMWENYLYTVAVSMENTVGHASNLGYGFETGTDGVVRNSFFRRIGASSGLAKYWAWEGPAGDLGTKYGRIENPTNWSNVDFALVLTSDELSDPPPGEVRSISQVDIDLTGQNFLRILRKFILPNPLTIQHKFEVLVDTDVVYSRTYSLGDEGKIVDSLLYVDVRNYQGLHTVKLRYTPIP